MNRKTAISIKIKRNAEPPSVKIRNLLPDSFIVNDKRKANMRKLIKASPIPITIDVPLFWEIILKYAILIVKQSRIIETITGIFTLLINFRFFI